MPILCNHTFSAIVSLLGSEICNTEAQFFFLFFLITASLQLGLKFYTKKEIAFLFTNGTYYYYYYYYSLLSLLTAFLFLGFKTVPLFLHETFIKWTGRPFSGVEATKIEVMFVSIDHTRPRMFPIAKLHFENFTAHRSGH